MSKFLKRSRLGVFLCWLWYGHFWNKTHSRRMMSRETNTCLICGKYKPGPD